MVAGNFEMARTGDGDRDIVAFLELERFGDNPRKADRETVALFGNFHGRFF
jgi:hypothetical protein